MLRIYDVMSDVKPQLSKWIYVFYVFTKNSSIWMMYAYDLNIIYYFLN